MKNKLLLKIIVATLSCFALSYLIANVGGLNRDEHFPNSAFSHYLPEFKCSPTDDSKNTTSVVKTYEAKEIKEIEITLVDSNISIEPSETNATELRYEGQTALKLKDAVDGKVLRFTENQESKEKEWKLNCGPGLWFNNGFNFNINASHGANLVLKIPKSIESVKIQLVSGDARIGAIQVKTLEVKTVSGDIRVKGDLPSVSAKTVTGDITLETTSLAPKLDAHATSGDVHLVLKKALDAVIAANAVSGDISFKGLDHSDEDEKSVHRTFGKGTGAITINTISGDEKIEFK